MTDRYTEIRYRLSDDARIQARLFKSELDNYRDAFTTGERADIKNLIEVLTALASKIEKRDSKQGK